MFGEQMKESEAHVLIATLESLGQKKTGFSQKFLPRKRLMQSPPQGDCWSLRNTLFESALGWVITNYLNN